MSVSKQLIHLRNVKGISQEELASLMNVTRQAVSKWETGQTLPDCEKIIRLSEIFGVTTDYLLKGKETDPMDIYSQHNSKSGTDMSSEVTEILDNIHQMNTTKRYFIGGGVLLAVIIIMIALIFLIN